MPSPPLSYRAGPIPVSAPAPIFLQRRAIIASSAVVVLITMIALAGGGIVDILIGLLTDGLFLLAWLAAAAGIGGMFFRLPPRRVENSAPASSDEPTRAGAALPVATKR